MQPTWTRVCTSNRKDGRPCAGPAVTGADKCRMHLGKKARPVIDEARAERNARAALAALDVQPVSDPLRELALLAGQVVAWKDAIAEQVNTLTGLRYEGNGAGEQLRAEVALWERALDRCRAVLVDIARLDLGAKMAAITEAQAALVEKAVMAALADAGLDLEATERARRVIGRHLRAVPDA